MSTLLATVADLEKLLQKTFDVEDVPHVEFLLEQASDAVRAAAGGHISQVRSVVTVAGLPDLRLPLPVWPVREVHDVTVDGAPSDWKLVDGSLWRNSPWRRGPIPSNVEVDVTFGFDPVPGRVKAIVSAIAANAINNLESGLTGQPSGVIAETLGAYRVSYSINPGTGQANTVDLFDIPDRTAMYLRNRFGQGTAYVVRSS